jgi:hypothetical protein
MIGQVSVAAATAALDYDLFQNTNWNTASKPRVVRALAVTGSAAINDAAFDFFIGQHLVGRFFNTRAGVIAPLQEDVVALGALAVPVGAKLAAIVADAPATNPLIVRVY